MKNLFIDIETRSSADIGRCGLYRYADDTDFDVLLFAYSVDGEPVRVIDLAGGEGIPEDVASAITDPSVTKWAHNAAFERVCLSRHLGMQCGEYLPPEQWKCSMVWASYLSFPPSLKAVGEVLKLEGQKMSEGKNLIRKFCVPPFEDCYGPDWETFKAYNARDVEVEMKIIERLSQFPVPGSVWEEYHLNERINDRGVLIDRTLAANAVELDSAVKDRLISEMKDITELDNPNSVAQLKGWLSDNGVETDSLGKKELTELLGSSEGEIRSVLELRQMSSKSSVKKYEAMLNAVCSDGRIHGLFRFYGASRTGRFSSQLVQLQNLPQNHLPDIASARELVRNNEAETLEMLYCDIPDTLSQLIRTALIPKKDTRFIVADFSAIEARVIAWLAGEDWRLDTFRNGGDIYCASASRMFGVPVEKHGTNGHLRQKGKVAELACGYGGGAGAMKAFGADKMGLSDDDLQRIVSDWRAASPNIVDFWWAVDNAAKECVSKWKRTETHGIRFRYARGLMFVTLPSGRELAYAKPLIGQNRFGGESITYMGIGTNKKWERLETYGPKLVENIVQGVARDILCNSMKNLAEFNIVAHVHDEIIIEAPPGITVDYVCSRMAEAPVWAVNLPLRADGYECAFYMKD